jgi:uridine phosphorylase
MEQTWYLKVGPQDMASHAVLVGDPARVHLFRERLTGATLRGQQREFSVLTGRYRDLPVSVVSTGIGAPASAIALEELALLGVRVVVRAGTMMAVLADPGTFILAHAACRFESTSRTYLPLEVPAVADPDLFAAFRAALDASGRPYAAGLVGTCDGFYTQMLPSPPGRDPGGLLDRFVSWKVAGVDMETSAIYTIARHLGMRAVSLCVATLDGRTRQMVSPGIRETLEQDLVDVTLQGLFAFADREGAGGRA